MSELTEVENEEPQRTFETKSEKYPAARWYVIQTQSNCEKKVCQNLEEAIIRQEAQEQILDIFNPIVESVALVNGQKKKRSTKPFAGYVFVFAVMDNEVFNIIKQTQRVIGFPSKSAGRPLPFAMPTKEIEKVIAVVDSQLAQEGSRFQFVEGVSVKIVNETLAFNGMVGIIKSCNNERGKAKIEIQIFDRPTEVEVATDSLEVYTEE
jgi:transcriptional antiterminator NusG